MFSRQSIKLSKDFYRHANAPASYQLAYWNRSYWIYGSRFSLQIKKIWTVISKLFIDFTNITGFEVSSLYIIWIDCQSFMLILIDSTLYMLHSSVLQCAFLPNVESTFLWKQHNYILSHLINTNTEKNK